MLKPSPSRRVMNTNAGLAMGWFLCCWRHRYGHEPKEYTILLKENGITPNGVSPGILVSSDSLFFYNVDGRENATTGFSWMWRATVYSTELMISPPR